MRWKKNEPTATLRRVLIAAYDSDGALADPRHTFLGTNEKLVDPSTGVFAVPGGTLANAVKPLVVADFTFTTTHATEVVNKAAHGLKTGDGPFRLTTTTTLPAGYALATDYWWIWLSADTGQFATSLANALAGTPQAITTDGTGTHTASDTATTQRLIDGHWTYTASQAEINITGTYFAVRLEHEATTGASSNYQETAGVVTLTGTGFLPRHVGRRITIAGHANANNNGEFTIASYVSATSITFANALAIDEVVAATFTIDDTVKPTTTSVDLDDAGAVHTGTAQAGGALSITLATAASATDGIYVDAIVRITGGTGAGQTNQIDGYTGATKVATVARAWAVVPDTSTEYELLPASSPTAAAQMTLNGVNIEGSNALADLVRGLVALVVNKSSGWDAIRAAGGNGDAIYYAMNGTTARVTVTYSTNGRPTIVINNLDA